jgi:hypothetical protein
MLTRKGLKAGGPVFRGRYAAVFYGVTAGFLLGDMDIGSPWQWFVRDSQQNLPNFHPHIWVDLGLAVFAGFLLFLASQYSDMAARSAWLTWAPDDVDWNGVYRGDEKRDPLLRPMLVWWHELVARKSEGEIDVQGD